MTNTESVDPGVKGHYHYAVYGRKLCSNVKLQTLVASDFDDRDFQFSWSVGIPGSETASRSVSSVRFTTNVGTDLVVLELEDAHSLLWEGRCEFIVSKDGSHIWCISDEKTGFGWMMSSLYSTVLSFTLHLQKIANIHAGCVATEHGAVGLMAAPGTGKSTLTAILAAKGFPFLTDDILAVTGNGNGYLAHSGYPTVSLTRESASVSLDSKHMNLYDREFQSDKARVLIDSEWATFSPDAVSLAALILLERDESGSSAILKPSRLSSVEATRAVIENTVCLPFLPKSALERYMKFAAGMVAGVPVWKLPLPGNLADLSAISPDAVSKIVAESST